MTDAQYTEWEELDPLDGDESSFDDDAFDDDAVSRPFMGPPGRKVEVPDEATRTADKPLSNRNAIPLFPDADKKQARVGKEIKVTKLDPPNHGVKGYVHLSADEEFIAKQWGDGLYTLEVLNNKKVSLQAREAVRISMGFNAEAADGSDAVTVNPNAETQEIIRQLNAGHAQERARSSRMHKEVLDSAKELANKHTDMVIEQAKQSAERDRDFFQASQTRTEAFFDKVLKQTTDTHEREMARMREENQSMLERIREDNNHKLEAAEQRHLQLMEILSSKHDAELKFVEASMDNDEDPTVRMLSEGGNMLKELRLAKQASGGARVPREARLPGRTPRPRAVRRGAQGGSGAAQSPKSATPAREVARDLAALKRECDNKGIDFRDLLRDARMQVQDYEPEPTSGDSPASGEDGVGSPNP